MNPETKELIRKQFKTLPKSVQNAILSAGLNEKLLSISKKHGLSLSQGAALENETMFVMLGLEHPKDYIKNLSKNAEIDIEKSRAIAKDVNENIFRSVRESLKQIHNMGAESDDKGGKEGAPAAGAGEPQKTGAKEEAGAAAVSGAEPPARTVPPPADLPTGRVRAPETPPPAVSGAEPSDEAGSLDREHILREVENPPRYNAAPEEKAPSAPTGETNVVEKKLTSTFHIPKESVRHEAPENAIPVREKPPVASDVEPPKKYGEDPYREPIE